MQRQHADPTPAVSPAAQQQQHSWHRAYHQPPQSPYHHHQQQHQPQQQPNQQQHQHQEQLASLVRQHFPPGISFGFAYGSGVFVQPDLYQPNAPAGSGPMLDFIFAVSDPIAWHQQNMQRNPAHYSFLRLLGPNLAHRVAERIGVGVYFNTLVPVGDQVVKYGVIGLPAFQQDLQHWSHLYVAGRLHKPVAVLDSQQSAAEAAYLNNLRAALSTALLLMPQPACSLKDLFKRITSLSYLGDVRMGLAEDSKKVERIVAGSYSHFVDTYLPLLQDPRYKQLGVTADEQGVIQQQQQQQPVQDSRVELMSSLPSVLLSRMAAKLGSALQPQHTAAAAAVLAAAAGSVSAQLPQLPQAARRDIAAAVLSSPQHRRLVKSVLHAIVAGSSRRQAVAGLLYAGPVKSLRYLGKKLAKAWR